MKSFLILTITIICLALSSCERDTPFQRPVLKVTAASGNSGTAGDRMQFDVSGTSSSNIDRFLVQEEINGSGTKKTLTDSNLQKSNFTFVYNYFIPMNRLKDDQIVLSFTVENAEKQSSTEFKTITVTASRPTITATGNKNSSTVGGQVDFVINVSSPVPNIGKVEIKQVINSGPATLIATQNYTNQQTATWNYGYIVPGISKPGDRITLIFLVTDAQGTQNQAVAEILVI